MGLNEILARFAVRAATVLVVEVPGHGATRMELEEQLLHRGWRPAWTPADADVLAVCGTPGPELSELVDRLWEQLPGPRVRADITSPSAAFLAAAFCTAASSSDCLQSPSATGSIGWMLAMFQWVRSRIDWMVGLVVPISLPIWASLSSGWNLTSHRIDAGRS